MARKALPQRCYGFSSLKRSDHAASTPMGMISRQGNLALAISPDAPDLTNGRPLIRRGGPMIHAARLEELHRRNIVQSAGIILGVAGLTAVLG